MRAFFKEIGILAVLTAVLLGGWHLVASAKPSASQPGLLNYPIKTGIAAETFASARTTDTIEVPGGNYNLLVLKVNYSASANAGNITMSCFEGTIAAPFAIQSCTVDTGVGTCVDASWLKAVTTTDTFAWRVDITGFTNVHCTLDHSAGAAGDVFTVTGYLTTK
jgi:hypothetical protein